MGSLIERKKKLMMQMIGGSEMVGELSQYRQVKVTPYATTYLMTSNPLSIRPKIIIISCDDDSPAATTNTNLIEGIIKLYGISGGAVAYKNTSGNYTNGGYLVEDDSTSNGRCGIYDGDIRINRVAGTTWSTSTEYTLDIYG